MAWRTLGHGRQHKHIRLKPRKIFRVFVRTKGRTKKKQKCIVCGLGIPVNTPTSALDRFTTTAFAREKGGFRNRLVRNTYYACKEHEATTSEVLEILGGRTK